MPPGEVPAFVKRLSESIDLSALALRFLILTAARTGEVTSMTWAEVDFDAAVWAVPASRMKTGKEHRVPLSPQAVDVLRLAREQRRDGEDWVWPGARHQRPVSNMVFLMLLRRLGRSDVTAHGFRSTFRDWAGDHTEHPREVIEAALAHAVGNDVERAYRRGDALDKRRRLMNEWGSFCSC